jgi:hypothetical protein
LASLLALPAGAGAEGQAYDYAFAFDTSPALDATVAGETATGSEGAATIAAGSDNLTKLDFTLSWKTDGPVPPRVRFKVAGPGGVDLGPAETQSAEGSLHLSASLNPAPGDEVVPADDEAAAWRALLAKHPAASKGKGDWKVQVVVDALPPPTGNATGGNATSNATKPPSEERVKWSVKATGTAYAAKMKGKEPAKDPEETPPTPETPATPEPAPDPEPTPRDGSGTDPEDTEPSVPTRDAGFSPLERLPPTSALLAGGALVGVAGALAVGVRRK